ALRSHGRGRDPEVSRIGRADGGGAARVAGALPVSSGRGVFARADTRAEKPSCGRDGSECSLEPLALCLAWHGVSKSSAKLPVPAGAACHFRATEMRAKDFAISRFCVVI